MTTIQQEQLFDEIDILPLDLKAKLVDKILNSINQTDDAIDNLWIKEVNRRKEEIESGEATLISGEEVFQKIQQRLK
jgi:putative addiction module component (TIGR02574 family)